VVTFGYASAGAVQAALRALGLTPARSDYGEAVRLTLHLAAGAVGGVQDRLRDATGGAARIEVGAPVAEEG